MAKQTSATTTTATNGQIVTIRALNVPDTPITATTGLERLVQEWNYILRVRSRWAADHDLRKFIAQRAVSNLGQLGLSRERLQALAMADHIEVEAHRWEVGDAEGSRIHETACELPWEYLLSVATRAEGRFQSLLISRMIDNGMSTVRPHQPASVLFVESAPGRLKEEYGFEDEEERIRAAIGDAGRRKNIMEIFPTPQVSELRDKIRGGNWQVIHVTGVDSHQFGWTIPGFYGALSNDQLKQMTDSSGRLRDGMVLRQGNESEHVVCYDELAEVLVNPDAPPRVVTLNLYYSGARIARELVKQRAHAAIGFLDEIDDELAELFFQSFYWAWCHNSLSVPKAFRAAWDQMRGKGRHGTSIVIWTGRSILDAFNGPSRSPRSQATTKRTKVSR